MQSTMPSPSLLSYFLLGCACLVLAAPCAQAQSAGDAGSTAASTAATAASFSATASLVSQYVSRGFRQSWGKPALQAGADYAHPSGWSLGTWASTVSERYIEDASVEWDVYGGYGGTVGELGYSVLAYYYKYPGAIYRATGVKYDYGELALGLGYKMLYARYNRTVTPDFFGITQARGTGYLDLGANIDLGHAITLSLHAGNGRVAGAGNGMWNWRDAKVGLSKAFDEGWSASAAVTRAWGATDAYDHYSLGVPNAAGQPDTSNPAAATLVLAINKTF